MQGGAGVIGFTLYKATTRGDAKNCYYPTPVNVRDEASFVEAINKDHVMALYQNNYRSREHFIQSNCLPFDCDNDHTNEEKEFITPFEIAMDFPDVAFAVSYSKSHGIPKGNVSARPRFHVFFPIPLVIDEGEYVGWKKEVSERVSYFDKKALDSARFLYGCEGEVEFYEGSKTIVEFLEEQRFEAWENSLSEIVEGGRNNAMSHIAGKLIKRYGDGEDVYQKFLVQAEHCNPPLPEEELKSIWYSAIKFGRKVASQAGYIDPDSYNTGFLLKPEDYSDVGQAKVFAREYVKQIGFTPSTDYIIYNGSFWEESKEQAQGLAQELTDRQLEEAEVTSQKAIEELEKNGGMDLILQYGEKKAIDKMNEIQTHAYRNYEQAQSYKKYAVKRRDSKGITNNLKEARPMLLLPHSILDSDEFLLNTPKATVHLKEGTEKEHDAFDYITKQTEVAPSMQGMELWLSALETIFQGDQELIDYVQRIVGLSAIGKVYVEALIISYGNGSNGKSTFWNAIARALGTYSGTISADILTVGCKRNVKPELAEAKGKRLLIAAEMEESVRLNTSNVKQLCSTDQISAEKKYKDPFDYTPSHTLVLYTNHLPKVGAIDNGTWRRLIVIPFDAKITGTVKNYGDVLFEQAGGAILQWIIEGAKKVIGEDYNLLLPQKVKTAIESYKENNDWLGNFLEECCDLGNTLVEKSGEVYAEYRAFCMRKGEYIRSTTDFYTALETEGFLRRRTSKCNVIQGLKLKSEFAE